MEKNIIINTDGGARGNPGPAAIGVVISDEEGKIIKEFGRYLGVATNNQAEYKALIAALEEMKNMDFGDVSIECLLDSELVVRQLNGQYKVKNEGIAPLFLQVRNLQNSFKSIIFKHIPREKNKRADFLVNESLNQKEKNDAKRLEKSV